MRTFLRIRRMSSALFVSCWRPLSPGSVMADYLESLAREMHRNHVMRSIHMQPYSMDKSTAAPCQPGFLIKSGEHIRVDVRCYSCQCCRCQFIGIEDEQATCEKHVERFKTLVKSERTHFGVLSFHVNMTEMFNGSV